RARALLIVRGDGSRHDGGCRLVSRSLESDVGQLKTKAGDSEEPPASIQETAAPATFPRSDGSGERAAIAGRGSHGLSVERGSRPIDGNVTSALPVDAPDELHFTRAARRRH